MYKVQNFGLIIWLSLILHIMLSFAEDNDQADVIKHCTNPTSSTSCSLTYEQVYQSLTKNESSFNISDALYPEGAKPSFLVRVNVFGPKKTCNSIPAKFTWSIHCLYANVPEWLLQILSLGSIIVTPRRQELNIQVPAFCCCISDDKKKRFLRRVQYQLQDLAMSPTIRDPSLNTAECVIQGHKPDFATTERSIHIRVMLWLSMAFALCSGHVLAAFMKTLQKSSKNTRKAICFSFQVLSILSILDILVALGYSIYYWVCYKPTFLDTAIILSLTIIVGASECFCQLFNSKSLGATAISYILCWLIIGIRINPTWGLTIALFVICVSAAVTFAAYIYLEVIHFDGNSNGTNGAGTNGDSSQDNSNGTAANSFVMSTIYCCCCCCCCHPNRQRNGTNGAGTNGENARDNSNDTAANSSAVGTINCCCRCCCYRHRNGNSNGTDGAGTNSDSGQYNGNSGTDANSYLINRNRRNTINSTDQASTKRTIFICVVGCFAVVSLFVIVFLAGHTHTGKEMAVDEVLKAISLYFLTAFMGWVTLNIERPDASQHSAVRNAPATSHERPPRNRAPQIQTTRV